MNRRRFLLTSMASASVTGIVAAVRPLVLRFHPDPLRVPASIGLVAGGGPLLAGVVAFWLERRRSSVAALATVAVGVVTTLLTFDVGARAPFYNRLYPIHATVKRLEDRPPSPAPRYILLPDVEFQAAREPWSLERVLAAVGSGAVRSPR